ncbi:conserved hypothetical protein [Betalipothrixvirus acidiani]|uniref:Uncharacterized protein n=1 Tax=Betalipothrixvirus acidiani TaxID=346881 RepID=A7WK90_9VIRU|nr:virion structural protein [Acidianus filamentous virus 3]CAL69590.1 conserved hypothetical protein [Acidianus filamentous virus 3]
MTDEFELVQKMLLVLKSTHDIQGYTVDSHTLERMVEMFIEETGHDFEYAFKKVTEVLHELGYNVA